MKASFLRCVVIITIILLWQHRSSAQGIAPIVIDGFKDSFYTTLTGPNDGYLQIRSYAHNENGAPVNDADLSAKIWTAWDEEWFYLYEEVMDDTLSGNDPQVWAEDVIELMFDPQPTDSVTNSVWYTRLTALGTGPAFSPAIVSM